MRRGGGFGRLCPVGGNKVSANVPGSSRVAGQAYSDVPNAGWATGYRRMKSRFSRSPGRNETVQGGPSAVTTLCRLLRIRRGHSASPAATLGGSSSTLSDNATGLGKPGSKTGGVTREASGTWSVSGVVAAPTEGPSKGIPGVYRGATTRGKRKVASPSATGTGPTSASSTTACSRGGRLPTRNWKTPLRSSSAIAARWPLAMAASYSSRA